jgi:hypothetical protein
MLFSKSFNITYVRLSLAERSQFPYSIDVEATPPLPVSDMTVTIASGPAGNGELGLLC